MTDPEHSLLRSAALASGLLSHAQIDDALAALAAEKPGPPAPLVAVPDDQLADKLIEMGVLNPWQAEQLKAGRTKFNLGEYQIIDSLGQGGMGQVFLAEHGLMGRLCAVKVLPKSKSTPEAITSFTREMRAIAQLDHHNLVRAYHAGRDGNVYYLVTEYVPGADLRQLIKQKGRLNAREAATVIVQSALALEHAHQRGLVHRDVKPGNVLVTPEGKVKLSDLGLAGFKDETIDDPRTGKIVGTADYLAPEVILSPHDVTPLSDIYSLGCTLYYAVTGKVPFPGGSTREKCRRHCNETPLHPRRFNPDLPEDLLEILADMMEKDPKKRVQSAAQVVQRLAPWTDEELDVPVPKVPPRPFARPHHARLASETSDSSAVFGERGLAPHESTSQASQGTVPVASGAHETTTVIDSLKRRLTLPGPTPTPGWLIAAIVTAVVLSGGVMLGVGLALFRAMFGG